MVGTEIVRYDNWSDKELALAWRCHDPAGNPFQDDQGDEWQGMKYCRCSDNGVCVCDAATGAL